MQIRAMTIQDYDAVCHVWRKGNIMLSASDEKPEIERMINHNPDTCLVGELDGQIIGAVLGGFDGRRGLIHHLAIVPDQQGKGYGTQLMDELERRYARNGVVKAHLFVHELNLQVIDYYQRIGYQVRNDFVTMSKSFPSPDEK